MVQGLRILCLPRGQPEVVPPSRDSQHGGKLAGGCSHKIGAWPLKPTST
jgi:hypothetical protein